MTGYKRPLLLFEDINRLTTIAAARPLQIVLAGKAHPHDAEGKEAIHRLHELIYDLRDRVTCVFLPNYDMQIAQALVSGTDIWVNTPLPPLEASGTSGMKAALNGVLNLSVLDGWWIEACVDGVTGWSIGTEDDARSADRHATLLYDKLETVVLPLFYPNREQWCLMMKQAIGNIGNTSTASESCAATRARHTFGRTNKHDFKPSRGTTGRSQGIGELTASRYRIFYGRT